MMLWLFFSLVPPELEDAAKHFQDAARVFEQETQSRAADRYTERKAGIVRAYEERIEQLEVEERSKRTNAIATFEAFLKKYPKDPTYSPDAIFRLAELYFERSSDEYFTASRAAEKNPALPQPLQNYDPSVALYRRLVAEFADYRLIDGAHYLLGYCLGEQGKEADAIAAYTTLVTRYPQSKWAVEAWTRMGEYAFDAGRLDDAITAYTHVLDHPDSSFYDKALYKLGWTYYRLDRFNEAVARFAQLVDYSDEKGKSDLRGEAMQYLGISFGEERWGSVDRAKAFFAKYPKKWSHEAFAMLGEVYFDQSKFTDAIGAYELALKVSPRDKNAPKVRDRQVTAYERLRDFDGAARARESLATDYAEKTPWANANASDTEALAVARELAEKSLLAAAVFHHQQAQSTKSPAEYALAAKSYERYLNRFPGAKNRYEMMYFLADCQYYAQQLGAAAITFGRVADDDSSDQYLEVSAFSAVVASEGYKKSMEAKGLLPARPVLTSADRKGQPKAVELPRPVKGLVEACDRYGTRVPKNEKTPAIAYKAAEALYAHDRFAEARERFAKIIEEFPQHEVARFSANLTIESFVAEQNWDEVEALATRLLKEGKGDDTWKAELKKFKLGAMFKRADAFEAGGKHEKAAAEYLRIVDESPQADFADKALNNAAVSYEKARRFESATRLYERLSKDYPESTLASAALFRVGVNSERFYDFNRAITAYLRLVADYPQSPQRPDALYNAAIALENTQRYDEAIDEYRRYATLFPDRKDASDVFFRAGRAAQSQGNKARASAIYEEFVTKYKKTAGPRLTEAHLRIGELATSPTLAKKAFLAAVKEGGPFAAEAQFRIAELAFAEYDAVAIDGSSKQQKAAIVKRAKLLQKARDAFSAVFAFKQVEWTLAALYRLGNLYETFADKLFAAPAPPEVQKMGAEYVEEYRVLIEEQAVPLEDKAVDAYKRAVAEAKKSGVANVWTKRTQRSLSKLRAKEFPLQKEARQKIETLGFATEMPFVAPAAIDEGVEEASE